MGAILKRSFDLMYKNSTKIQEVKSDNYMGSNSKKVILCNIGKYIICILGVPIPFSLIVPEVFY